MLFFSCIEIHLRNNTVIMYYEISLVLQFSCSGKLGKKQDGTIIKYRDPNHPCRWFECRSGCRKRYACFQDQIFNETLQFCVNVSNGGKYILFTINYLTLPKLSLKTLQYQKIFK